jgi:hypothetical protein
MPTRHALAPRSAYLLRVAEVRDERIRMHYELLDLRSGFVHRFGSLAALTRFLRAQGLMVIADRGRKRK